MAERHVKTIIQSVVTVKCDCDSVLLKLSLACAREDGGEMVEARVYVVGCSMRLEK